MNSGVHLEFDYGLHCNTREMTKSEKVFTSTVPESIIVAQISKNTEVYYMLYFSFFVDYIMQQSYQCECRK